MKEQRSALLLTWLNETSAAAVQESRLLSDAIENTQSDIGMELGSWNEMMADLADTERKVQEHARVLHDLVGRDAPGA